MSPPDSDSGPALIGIEPTIFPNAGTQHRALAGTKFLRNTWYVVTPADQLKPGEIYSVPIRVSVPKEQLKDYKHDIVIVIQAKDAPELEDRHKTVFIGPK